MTRLLRCPFCGGQAEVEREGTGRQSCIIECTECAARLETNETGEHCGSQWNTRSYEEKVPTSEPKQSKLKVTIHAEIDFTTITEFSMLAAMLQQVMDELRGHGTASGTATLPGGMELTL